MHRQLTIVCHNTVTNHPDRWPGVMLLTILALPQALRLTQVNVPTGPGALQWAVQRAVASEFSETGVGMHARLQAGVRMQLRPRADTAQAGLEGSWRLFQLHHLLREKP